MEENHLLRGRYAKISTDDRGLYFFTEGRRPEVKKYGFLDKNKIIIAQKHYVNRFTP